MWSSAPGPQRVLAAAGTAGTLVLAATAIALLITTAIPDQDPAIIFLAAVLLSAVLGGATAGVTASLGSVLVLDVFFTHPRLSLRIANPADLVSLAVFLAVAAIGATLTARLRRQADAARHLAWVRGEQRRIEAIIESIDDGLVVLSPDGVVRHVNEVACAILGFAQAEVVGRAFDDLAAPHSHYLRLRETVRNILAHPDQGPPAIELASFLRGRDHFYVLRHTPLRPTDDAPAGVILVLQDITHVRDHEQRREALMATLSHELRTPLTSLRMAGELLTRATPPLPTAQARIVDAIHEDVGRLEDLATRLLDLSRSRAVDIALERQPIALAGALTRLGALFALQAETAGVSFEVRPPATPVSIVGDPTKLTWALSNLVANALRYTPAGGRITVEASADDTTARVTVADTGRGIPPERTSRIFDPFVQGGDGAPDGAAGLGLAIVRDIVQAHGGRVHVESAVGRGSRFTITLPRS